MTRGMDYTGITVRLFVYLNGMNIVILYDAVA